MFETYPDNMEIMFGHDLSIIIMYAVFLLKRVKHAI